MYEKRVKEKNMIFGLRAIIEAVDAGKEFDKVCVRRELDGALARELIEKLRRHAIPTQRVPAEKLNRLTDKNHQGAVAFLSAIEYKRIDDIVPMLYEQGRTPLVVLLDGITDVRNFGAIARTCECAGIDALVVPTNGGASVNADAIKTSAGALHTLPVCREQSLHNCVSYLQKCGIRVAAATEHATHGYTECDFTLPTAIVMGAEDTGVSPDILRICDDKVSVPILGRIESLNVSVAAGIVVYEAVRQRQHNQISTLK